MNDNSITRMQHLFKPVIAVFLFLLLIGGGVFIFFQAQKQQETRGRASTATWLTAQSATAICGGAGSIVINVSFTNLEPSRSMIVSVTDQQSSQSANLDVIGPGATKTGVIDTKMPSLASGKVIFDL